MSVKPILRILVVGSCGKKKLVTAEQVPRCKDIVSKTDILTWKKRFESYSNPARDMYTGNQHRELVKGVLLLREIADIEVVLKIISAGFGLLDEYELVPPYECSFLGMKKTQIINRSKRLNIGKDFKELCETKFDLIYLALGANYFLALDDGWKDQTHTTILGFDHRLVGESILRISSGPETVHAFSLQGHKIHGVAGFKGDLLRILANYALNSRNPYHEVLKWKRPDYLYSLLLRLSGLSGID